MIGFWFNEKYSHDCDSQAMNSTGHVHQRISGINVDHVTSRWPALRSGGHPLFDRAEIQPNVMKRLHLFEGRGVCIRFWCFHICFFPVFLANMVVSEKSATICGLKSATRFAYP